MHNVVYIPELKICIFLFILYILGHSINKMSNYLKLGLRIRKEKQQQQKPKKLDSTT